MGVAAHSGAPVGGPGSNLVVVADGVRMVRGDRLEHTAGRRPGERLAVTVVERRGEALLGRAELLDGDEGGEAHGTAS